MSNLQEEFYLFSPSQVNYWRAIILFGKNTATYKFALAKAILESHHNNNDLITLEQIALPFSVNICRHLTNFERQITAKNSKYLEACKNFNLKLIDEDELINCTLKYGFNHVFDAFHNIAGKNIENLFFIDERKHKKSIRITENLYKLVEENPVQMLYDETESRWNLVEFAWNNNLSTSLIEYDNETNFLFDRSSRRINLTSTHSSLNGYQKGKCFYCSQKISINKKDINYADVDHVLPFKLSQFNEFKNLNGIWNLVLSCKECNRGPNGKFDKIIHLKYLVKLHRRNEYLITSHHPLRETLIKQTGKNTAERINFLQTYYNHAKQLLIHEWQTDTLGENDF
ncbi:HNH endonuclease domain-containing protein [Thorsellia kenyensis]|uniref:HNH endonuclease domain-containing protein n=1 Tax=Thorsellia kenyensis TaxID=1549888 RepID=A0ABV6CCY4_9GAMM